MGGKGLKGIVIDDGEACPALPQALQNAQDRLARALARHPFTGERLASFGTAALLNIVNAAGGLPTRNFRSGWFDGAERVSGERLSRNATSRQGGKVGQPCVRGCSV